MAPRIRLPSQGPHLGRIGLGLLLLTAIPVGASIVRDAAEERRRSIGRTAMEAATTDDAVIALVRERLVRGARYAAAFDSLRALGFGCPPPGAYSPPTPFVLHPCSVRVVRDGATRRIALDVIDSAGVVVGAQWANVALPTFTRNADGSLPSTIVTTDTMWMRRIPLR